MYCNVLKHLAEDRLEQNFSACDRLHKLRPYHKSATVVSSPSSL